MVTFEEGGRFSDAKESVRLMISDAFPDAELWQEFVRLAPNTEDRARHLTFDTDWYYVDDFAIEYYQREPNHPPIEIFLNHRILQVDPFDDGKSLVDFLQRISTPSTQ
jgi:hypothetical protein